jgi:hypothetical protein
MVDDKLFNNTPNKKLIQIENLFFIAFFFILILTRTHRLSSPTNKANINDFLAHMLVSVVAPEINELSQYSD